MGEFVDINISYHTDDLTLTDLIDTHASSCMLVKNLVHHLYLAVVVTSTQSAKLGQSAFLGTLTDLDYWY